MAGNAVVSNKAFHLSLESRFGFLGFVGKLEAKIVIRGGRDNTEARATIRKKKINNLVNFPFPDFMRRYLLPQFRILFGKLVGALIDIDGSFDQLRRFNNGLDVVSAALVDLPAVDEAGNILADLLIKNALLTRKPAVKEQVIFKSLPCQWARPNRRRAR